MPAATDEELGNTHSKLSKVMNNALDRMEDRASQKPIAIEDEEGNVLDVKHPEEVNPAMLAVITKFLKDNEVTCARGEDEGHDELRDKMRKRKKVGNVTHIG